MTLHVHSQDYKCPKCDGVYVLYDKNVRCPYCGILEETIMIDRNFIPQAAGSLLYNLENYGSYTPMLWGQFSFGDYVLHFLFPVFDQFEQAQRTDFKEFANEYLSGMVFKDSKYAQEYYLSIAIRINENLRELLKPRDFRRLEQYFRNSKKDIETLSFKEIENILGFDLPEEAYLKRPWWANIRKGCHTHVWFNAGWKVDSVNMEKGVTFKKIGASP